MVNIPGKDVELRVYCHQIAEKLRKQGKPTWAKKLGLQAIMKEEPENNAVEYLINKCHRIACLMKSVVDPKHLDLSDIAHYDPTIAEALELMGEACESDFEDVEEGMSWMNYLLADIYDYCDIHRIWTGN